MRRGAGVGRVECAAGFGREQREFECEQHQCDRHDEREFRFEQPQRGQLGFEQLGYRQLGCKQRGCG